jgi:hypothetical protein
MSDDDRIISVQELAQISRALQMAFSEIHNPGYGRATMIVAAMIEECLAMPLLGGGTAHIKGKSR